MYVLDFVSALHEFTNLDTNCPELSVDEVIYGNDLLDNHQSPIVWPDRERVLLIKHVATKIPQHDQLVVDAIVRQLLVQKHLQG